MRVATKYFEHLTSEVSCKKSHTRGFSAAAAFVAVVQVGRAKTNCTKKAEMSKPARGEAERDGGKCYHWREL